MLCLHFMIILELLQITALYHTYNGQITKADKYVSKATNQLNELTANTTRSREIRSSLLPLFHLLIFKQMVVVNLLLGRPARALIPVSKLESKD